MSVRTGPRFPPEPRHRPVRIGGGAQDVPYRSYAGTGFAPLPVVPFPPASRQYAPPRDALALAGS